jgi:hypothetical protein
VAHRRQQSNGRSTELAGALEDFGQEPDISPSRQRGRLPCVDG